MSLSESPQPDFVEKINRNGFAVIRDAVDSDAIADLLQALSELDDGKQNEEGIKRRGSVYAIRDLLDAVPSVRDLTDSPAIRALVEPVLGRDCFPVRGLLFDKTEEANWKVPWHQDISIAVREKTAGAEAAGFTAWSHKAGTLHVQPPASVLETMLALRLHLDDCDERNAPLRVLSGSHRLGKMDAEAIARQRENTSETVCVCPRGGVMLMRPLLLHASSGALEPRHRRVIHIEWASESLPAGLQWQR